MDKLKMQTPDLTKDNIKKIAKLFPQVLTEKEDESGKTVKGIDFELLKQALSKDLVEENDERYRLDWPGKKASLLKANTPIKKTLRPCEKESVDFENTENVYIEGDNFEVLKILQESYLNKVKMIYIDPPYNTGKDFVYRDNYKVSKDEYEEEIGAVDEDGDKLFKNTDTNGRFHSDWLSMMYERLIVARDLLKDDGVIFISIDDNEVHNLRKICDEVFGEENFVGVYIWNKKNVVQNDATHISVNHEYILIYSKMFNELRFNLLPRTDEQLERYKNPDNDPRGAWTSVALQAKSGSSVYEMKFDNGVTWKPVNGTYPRLSRDSLLKAYKENRLWFGKSNRNVPRLKKYLTEVQNGVISSSLLMSNDVGSTQLAKEKLKKLFNDNLFDTPKPLNLIMRLMQLSLNENNIALDFFSGSATTAHAVMQLNAEDGGNRKFVMVQLAEKTAEDSEAFKAKYKTIAEIGKERIRRAGKKIKEDNKDKEGIKNLDTGFRVYKTETTNMKDVYYLPSDLKQESLTDLISNIKEDRKPEDLLTQVILAQGLELSLPIEKKEINGNAVFIVQKNALVACFDDKINLNTIDEIVEIRPLRVVFRDSCFKDDKDAINMKTKFKRLSPDTKIEVL